MNDRSISNFPIRPPQQIRRVHCVASMASFSLLFLLQLVAAAAAMRAAACAAPSAGISQLLEPVKDANAVASYHTCRTTRAEPSMSMTLTSTRARVSHILLFTEELALECEARIKADEVAFDDLATQVFVTSFSNAMRSNLSCFAFCTKQRVRDNWSLFAIPVRPTASVIFNMLPFL
eukprot:2959976-Pleurochrysis_carterae.AAC.2